MIGSQDDRGLSATGVASVWPIAYEIKVRFLWRQQVTRSDRIPRSWSAQGTESKPMRIQPSMLIVPLLATVLMNPVIRGIWEPSSDAPRSSRVDLAQLPAPTGHRQPTLNDLPPWLRDEEKPGAEASPTQDPQAGRADVEQRDRSNKQPRTPRVQPDDGVPRICNPC